MLSHLICFILISTVLVGCADTSIPTNPTPDELAQTYLWNAPVGTTNVLSVVNTSVSSSPADSTVKHYFWYYRVVDRNVTMPNGSKGVMCTTWFSDSPDLVDTIFYFVDGRSIYFRYPHWTHTSERGLVVTVPVQVGDSLKLGVAERFTHKVVELDKNIEVGDRTFKCLVLQSTDTTTLGSPDQVSVYSQELYFAPEVMQVKTVVNRTVTNKGVVEKRSSSTIELIKVIPGR